MKLKSERHLKLKCEKKHLELKSKNHLKLISERHLKLKFKQHLKLKHFYFYFWWLPSQSLILGPAHNQFGATDDPILELRHWDGWWGQTPNPLIRSQTSNLKSI